MTFHVQFETMAFCWQLPWRSAKRPSPSSSNTQRNWNLEGYSNCAWGGTAWNLQIQDYKPSFLVPTSIPQVTSLQSQASSFSRLNQLHLCWPGSLSQWIKESASLETGLFGLFFFFLRTCCFTPSLPRTLALRLFSLTNRDLVCVNSILRAKQSPSCTLSRTLKGRFVYNHMWTMNRVVAWIVNESFKNLTWTWSSSAFSSII